MLGTNWYTHKGPESHLNTVDQLKALQIATTSSPAMKQNLNYEIAGSYTWPTKKIKLNKTIKQDTEYIRLCTGNVFQKCLTKRLLCAHVNACVCHRVHVVCALTCIEMLNMMP